MQTEKILMRRLIRSRLIWITTVWKCVSEINWYPNLPDLTLYHLAVVFTAEEKKMLVK